MPIKLEQLGELVTTIANERGISATVVAVLPGRGEGCYTEAMLDVLEGSVAGRVSIGLQHARNTPPSKPRTTGTRRPPLPSALGLPARCDGPA